MPIYIPASHNPQTSSAPHSCAARHCGHHGGRDRGSVGLRLGRRIPSCRHYRIRGSARWGVRGRSVWGRRSQLDVLEDEEGRWGKDIGVRDTRGGRTVSQIVTWESAGQPVQPQYCSSPKDLTMIGLSIVPAVRKLASGFLLRLTGCFDIRGPKL